MLLVEVDLRLEPVSEGVVGVTSDPFKGTSLANPLTNSNLSGVADVNLISELLFERELSMGLMHGGVRVVLTDSLTDVLTKVTVFGGVIFVSVVSVFDVDLIVTITLVRG